MSGRTIDAHLHLWSLGEGGYGWLTPDSGELYADMTADRARAELDAAGIDDAILVQADDTLADTAFLLDQAARNDWITGVVGWIPLDDPAGAQAALERWERSPAFCGVRHLVHDDPRDDFLELPAVRRSLGIVADRGLPFDVPDAWPRHFARAVDLAGVHDSLTVVIDHLAKPPVGRDGWEDWLATFRRAGTMPNIVVKFSGLHLPGVPFGVAELRPLWELALETFGPGRILYGGDWPMSLPHGGYQPTWQAMRTLIDELSVDERDLVLGGTAAEVYRR